MDFSFGVSLQKKYLVQNKIEINLLQKKLIKL